MKNWIVCSFVLVSLGCTHVRDQNRITGRIDERPKINNQCVALLAAPVNLIPDIISNYVVGLYPGNLWPIQYLLWPISGLVWGVQDAIHGYPFWSPSAMYE